MRGGKANVSTGGMKGSSDVVVDVVSVVIVVVVSSEVVVGRDATNKAAISAVNSSA